MTVSNDVAQLARDLDRAPRGEEIVERLLSAQVKLQRENAQMAAENAAMKVALEKVVDQIGILTQLIDDHHTVDKAHLRDSRARGE
jgi:hypothetical protein